jgi:CDP-glucose 4,6-dehydratase
LVRDSYAAPLETFSTNVVGTASVYEACRRVDTVHAIVSITTDKVYQNHEWDWGYREVDALGGHDPYSASKACAEVVSSSYRNSFWPLDRYGRDHRVLVATVRAGNVIGGGDWAKDRLIPDLMRAAERNEEATIRNPQSTRPWQHVLDPLLGYLMLGRQLLLGHQEFAEAWNFGPSADDSLSVADVVTLCQQAWSALRVKHESKLGAPHEATRLALDCAKAQARIGWRPVWESHTAIERTIDWYREHYENKNAISVQQLRLFVREAHALGMRGFA